MNKLIIILLILITQQPTIAQAPVFTTTEVNAARISTTLTDLIAHLNALAPYSPDLLKTRKREILKTWYTYTTTIQRIKLLKKQNENLKQIWLLHKALAKQNEVTDIQLLNVYNNFLSSQTALVSEIGTSQQLILDLARLCNVEVTITRE